MMRSLLVLTLLAPSTAWADPVRLLEQQNGRLVLEVRTGVIRETKVLLAGQEMVVWTVEGGLSRRTPGVPDLPYFARLVGTLGPDASVEVQDIEAETFEGMAFAPAPSNPKRCKGGRPVRWCDPVAYTRPGLWPEAFAELDSKGTMAGQPIARLVINPVRFDPTTGHTVLARRMLVVVHLGKGAGQRPIPLSIYEVLGKVLLNGPLFPPGPDRLLVVAADDLAPYIETYAEWRRFQGIESEVVPLFQVGAIKAFVKARYEGPSPPSYLLLVGDAGLLPPLYPSGTYPSDWLYGAMDDDLYSDVLVSRLSANTPEGLQTQVERLRSLEEAHPWPDGGQWLGRAIFISSSEGDGPSNDDAYCDTMAALFEKNGFTLVDRLYHSKGNDKAEAVVEAINQGRGVVTYLGHGSGTSWDTTTPPFDTGYCAKLANLGMNPFIMDISCKNGRFDMPKDCLAEAFLKVGPKSGAVAIYSSTSDTVWDAPAILAKAAYEGLFEQGLYRLAAMLAYGRLRMVEEFGATDETREVVQQFVLLGDGLLGQRTRPPDALAIEAPKTVPTGTTALSLRVTRGPGDPVQALVAVHTGPFFAAAYTDLEGQASFALPPVTAPVIVVATARDAVPEVAVIDVAPTGCGLLLLPKKVRCDEDIPISLWDKDLDILPSVQDTAQVEATMPGLGPSFIVLTETGDATGVFAGSAPVPKIAGLHGQVAAFSYMDAQCKGGHRLVQATATFDCQGPLVTTYFIKNIAPFSATAAFTTDEPAVPTITCVGGGKSLTFEGPLATNHAIFLKGLVPETEYTLSLDLFDQLGNHASFPPPPEVWTFTTVPCIPDCTDLECGDDGCGGSCGECSEGQWCKDGRCEGGPGCLARQGPGWPGARCEACVCSLDDYCCKWGVWDNQCVAECRDVCGGCGPLMPDPAPELLDIPPESAKTEVFESAQATLDVPDDAQREAPQDAVFEPEPNAPVARGGGCSARDGEPALPLALLLSLGVSRLRLRRAKAK